MTQKCRKYVAQLRYMIAYCRAIAPTLAGQAMAGLLFFPLASDLHMRSFVSLCAVLHLLSSYITSESFPCQNVYAQFIFRSSTLFVVYGRTVTCAGPRFAPFAMFNLCFNILLDRYSTTTDLNRLITDASKTP